MNAFSDVVYRKMMAELALEEFNKGRLTEADLSSRWVEDFNCGAPPGTSGYATMCPHCVADAYGKAVESLVRGEAADGP